MRILTVSDSDLSPDSGMGGTVYHLVDAFRRQGHDVDVISRKDLPHRIRHGNLHYVFELPAALRRVIRRASGNRPYDVIQVSQPHGYLAARDHQRGRRRGLFVHFSHGLELRVSESLRYWRSRRHEPQKGLPGSLASLALARLLARHSRLAFRDCDGTVVGNSLCAKFLQERFQVPANRIAVIPHGIPGAFLEPVPRGAALDRRRRVLYVGQFAYVKGPALVAEAFRGLARKFPDVSFTWVCASEHHTAVRALLGPAAERCELLPWMKQEELRAVYDRHGVFLFPSFFEGFGKAFLEAMARGLCVVASDEGGMHDLIRSGENGFLVPVGDGAALLEAASKVIEDGEIFDRISEAARTGSEEFTWDVFAKRHVQFYESLLRVKGQW